MQIGRLGGVEGHGGPRRDAHRRARRGAGCTAAEETAARFLQGSCHADGPLSESAAASHGMQYDSGCQTRQTWKSLLSTLCYDLTSNNSIEDNRFRKPQTESTSAWHCLRQREGPCINSQHITTRGAAAHLQMQIGVHKTVVTASTAELLMACVSVSGNKYYMMCAVFSDRTSASGVSTKFRMCHTITVFHRSLDNCEQNRKGCQS